MEASSYDIEIQDLIIDEVQRGDITIDSDVDKYFSLIENHYPMGFSGIDWNEKGSVFYYDLSDLSVLERRNRVEKILKEFIVKNEAFENEPIVVVVGDGAIEQAYCMTFSKFLEFNNHFINLPQHTYIYFQKMHKCINYTFEDELIYG